MGGKVVNLADKMPAEDPRKAEVLAELDLIAHSDLCDYTTTTVDGEVKLTVKGDAKADAWRAVQSVKRKIFLDVEGGVSRVEIELKLWSKIDALRMLGQHLGLWKGDAGEPPLPSDVYHVFINRDPPDDDET